MFADRIVVFMYCFAVVGQCRAYAVSTVLCRCYVLLPYCLCGAVLCFDVSRCAMFVIGCVRCFLLVYLFGEVLLLLSMSGCAVMACCLCICCCMCFRCADCFLSFIIV